MSRSNKTHSNDNPRYFELLSENEKVEYLKLREQLSSPNYKNRRNKSNKVFQNMVESIKEFAIRNDENDWKRSLVCGIIWLNHSIAINTHQLRLLITKCKSSINGSFQALGYETIPTAADSTRELITKFPFLRHNFPELRQWTVRQKLNIEPLASVDISKLPKAKEEIIIDDLKKEITPPPDIIENLSEKNENDAFSLSFNGQQNADFLPDEPTFLNTTSCFISDSLKFGLNLEEKESLFHHSSIEDCEFILPKSIQNFENDPLIFFPNITF